MRTQRNQITSKLLVHTNKPIVHLVLHSNRQQSAGCIAKKYRNVPQASNLNAQDLFRNLINNYL